MITGLDIMLPQKELLASSSHRTVKFIPLKSLEKPNFNDKSIIIEKFHKQKHYYVDELIINKLFALSAGHPRTLERMLNGFIANKVPIINPIFYYTFMKEQNDVLPETHLHLFIDAMFHNGNFRKDSEYDKLFQSALLYANVIFDVSQRCYILDNPRVNLLFLSNFLYSEAANHEKLKKSFTSMYNIMILVNHLINFQCSSTNSSKDFEYFIFYWVTLKIWYLMMNKNSYNDNYLFGLDMKQSIFYSEKEYFNISINEDIQSYTISEQKQDVS